MGEEGMDDWGALCARGRATGRGDAPWRAIFCLALVVAMQEDHAPFASPPRKRDTRNARPSHTAHLECVSAGERASASAHVCPRAGPRALSRSLVLARRRGYRSSCALARCAAASRPCRVCRAAGRVHCASKAPIARFPSRVSRVLENIPAHRRSAKRQRRPPPRPGPPGLGFAWGDGSPNSPRRAAACARIARWRRAASSSLGAKRRLRADCLRLMLSLRRAG